MKYPNLLSEGKIGGLTIRNRVVMTAMDVALANYDGSSSDDITAFYVERAKGGVGLIINGITRVDDETGIASLRQLSVTGDDKIPALKKMTDAVHMHGAKMFCQLHHPGRQTMCALNGDRLLRSASTQACGLLSQPTIAMTIEEIHAMVEKFISGAVRAQKGGYDGVELHCAHGYLLQEFLSPYTNHRTDEYGGSLENRMRIVNEIIAGIREKCGRDFPISVRISAEEFLELIGNPSPCLTLSETVPMCQTFEKNGVDVINVSAGIYETINCIIEPSSFKEGWRAGLMKAVKSAVSIPVMGAAVIRHPEFAEKLLADGNQDFICMGRTHLADPEWVKKIQEGRENEIRKCICCLHCFESLFNTLSQGGTIECAINPRTAHELAYGELNKDGGGRVVAVVGAGPAGMEAARVLALRGFKPIVIEKEDRVGGQMNIADKPNMKYRISELTDTMKAQLDALGVEIRLGTEATADYIKAMNPYAVIIATGGKPVIPSFIPGYDNDNVYLSTDVLKGKVNIDGKRVAVIGGGHTGLETAEFLAMKGHAVTVVEMANAIGPDMYAQNLVDITMSLTQLGVKILVNHQLLSIEGNTVNLKYLADLSDRTIEADCIVMSLGTVSVNALAKELEGIADNVAVIGDATHPAKIGEATRSAYLTASKI